MVALRSIHRIVLAGLLLISICAPACRSARADEPVRQRAAIAGSEPKIIPGCELNIVVDGEPEISHAYSVDAAGLLHFIISDSGGQHRQSWDVSVTGKSVMEAKTALQTSLAEYFKSPTVQLSILRMPGMRIEITGEVLRQGAYVLPYNSRVSDLLGAAPTKPTADFTNILLRRAATSAQSPSGPTTYIVDLTLAAADENDDPKLENGDKIFIRRRGETPVMAAIPIVRVVGEINLSVGEAPSAAGRQDEGIAIPLSPDMKFKDVLARIGGLKETADRNHVYLGRLDGTTRTLNADKIEADDPENNLKVSAGDMLIVPKRDRSLVYAVLGEVNHPNTFPYRSGAKMNLLQALSSAGDLSKKADRHHGVLSKGYLLDPTKSRQVPFDPELVKKGEQPNMEIEPGDAVFIDRRKKRPTFWQQLLPLALHFLPF